MSRTFDSFFEELIQVEGGYSDNPNDSGGKTKYGITEAVARAHGYVGSMRDLPLSEAKILYKKRYWDVLKLDDVDKLSSLIARKLADIAVNMGHNRAGTFLQRSLNVLNRRRLYYPDLVVDGNVGDITLEALRKFVQARGGVNGPLVLHRCLSCLQGAFYIELAERREKDEEFLYGWILNRIH